MVYRFGTPRHRQTEVDAFVVRLEDVKPYPKEGAAISPDDYRVTLVVTRR